MSDQGSNSDSGSARLLKINLREHAQAKQVLAASANVANAPVARTVGSREPSNGRVAPSNARPRHDFYCRTVAHSWVELPGRSLVLTPAETRELREFLAATTIVGE